MADPFLHEDDELEKVKAWWKENGKSIIIGVGLGLAIIIGTNAWKSWKIRQAEQGSALYEQMMVQQDSNKEAFTQAAQNLMSQYGSTGYAGLAGLMLAKQAWNDGDKAAAQEKLEWVMNNAKMPSQKNIARIRLATVYLDSGNRDQAASLLAVPAEEKVGFESWYAELAGDLKHAAGDIDGARDDYTTALKDLASSSDYRDALQMKLDNVGGESVNK